MCHDPGERSHFSTVLVNLPDFLFSDEPVVDVVVDNGAGSSVILSSDLDSFCISGSILLSLSCEAVEVT